LKATLQTDKYTYQSRFFTISAQSLSRTNPTGTFKGLPCDQQHNYIRLFRRSYFYLALSLTECFPIGSNIFMESPYQRSRFLF